MSQGFTRGVQLDNDPTLAGNSQFVAPTVYAIKTYTDTALALKANDADVVHKTGNETVAGDKTFSGTTNLSALTASQILATDGSKNIQTLTTATYPSLTELSYVKGVTSSIQTQISGLVPTSRTLTINGTSQDLSANRSWTVSSDPLTDIRTKGFYFDDFDVATTVGSGVFINNTQFIAYGGTWQVSPFVNTGLNMWGVIQINTFNSTASMGFGANAFMYQTLLGGATFETRVRFEDLSTGTDRFTYYAGFLTYATFNANNRIRFNYSDNINSGKFQIECNSGGASSTADSGVTVAADTWYVLKFVINSAANSVEFFINGSSVGTLSSNIPSTGVYPYTQINRSTYANTRQVYIDYLFTQTTVSR